MSETFYRDPSTGRILVDRRSGLDRRDSGKFVSPFGHPRRRKKGGRRKTDRGGYVDFYDARTWTVILAVLILSLFDAVLTGLHIVRGTAHELNPLLEIALSYGGIPGLFVVKAALTVLPMAVILVHKEWTLGRYAARLCLWSYILVSVYHLYLVFGLQALGSPITSLHISF
jgi:hypothetical protein